MTRIACLLLMLLLWPRPAVASCVFMGPLCQTWRSYDAIFDGTVLSIERVDRTEEMGAGRTVTIGHRLVTFTVHERWRGAVGEQVRLLLWGGFGWTTSNGFDVRLGGRYLIFANRVEGEFTTSSCSPSRAYSDSSEALEFLRSLATPGKGGRISGELFVFSPSTRGGAGQPIPMTASVRISGPGYDRTIPIDDRKFEVAGLQPGTYTVTVEAPPAFDGGSESQIAVIPDAHACHHARFSYQPNTRISGQILDPDGRPARGVRVEAAEATTWEKDPFSPVTDTTDEQGRFTFRGLAPGEYVVGINLRDAPSAAEAHARLTYPGAGLPPQPVRVSLSDHAELGALRLEPPLREVAMALRLTWEGGLPIANTAVRVEDVTGGPRPERQRPIANSRTDRYGGLRLSGRASRTYVVTVWRYDTSGPVEIGRSDPFAAEAASAGLALVLRAR